MRGVPGSGEAPAWVRPHALFVAQPTETLESLRQFLESRNCTVSWCMPVEAVARRVSDLAPHLIVISMPRLLDLLDLCRAARGASPAPILVLGQRDAEEDEVLCVEDGVDTYLPPHASPRRLQAYTWALVQRTAIQVPSKVETLLSIGAIRLDMPRQRVYRGDEEVKLTSKEFSLLRLLMQNAGRTLSRQALNDAVWGAGNAADNRTLDVHIRWLREKLEVDAGNPQFIRTVRSVGYCFEP